MFNRSHNHEESKTKPEEGKPSSDSTKPENLAEERKEVAGEIHATPDRPREQTQRMETIQQVPAENGTSDAAAKEAEAPK